MFTFKYEDKHYTAYSHAETGNPHEKQYPCLVCLETDTIAENQMKVLKDFFASKGLDYHEVIHYADKDINTHDLVIAAMRFHTMKKI